MDALASLKTNKAPSFLSLAKGALQSGLADVRDFLSDTWEDTKEKLNDVYENRIMPAVNNIVYSTSNETRVGAYDWASKVGMPKWVRDKHAAHNQEALDAAGSVYQNTLNPDGSANYIENQNNSGWENIQYGLKNLNHSGCGIFATYNTLIALGVKVTSADLVDIITEYEKSGNTLGGLAGTSPLAISKYLTKRGHQVKVEYDTSDESLDRLGESTTYSAFIDLSLLSDTDVRAGGHYVGISRKDNPGTDKSSHPHLFNSHNSGDHTDHKTLSSAANYYSNMSHMCMLGVSGLKVN